MGRVRLTALDLTGFKSFPDRVELGFPSSVTAVIGPNGCGKSNLVDAILWVLGEQSTRALRLKQMGDVVFAGAAGRQGAGAAEVTIELRSDDGRWADTDGRLKVTRRVFRSGPSEYRLNGRAARLKDVFDELASVGLGTRAYAVIEQDRVGQVLSARPTDRRALLEEAAGITRYKARRHEAELKLEGARQNLLRLDDVVAEVDRSLRQLKRQARDAERYREVEGQLQAALETLHTVRAHRLDERRQALRRARAEAENEVAAAASALAGAEADLAQGRQRLEAVRGEVEGARSEVAALAASRERLEAFLERSADLLDNLGASLDATRTERSALAAARTELEGHGGEVRARLEEATAAAARVAQEVAAAAELESAARAAQTAAEHAAERRRQDLLRAISGLTAARNRLRDLEREDDRAAYALRQLGQEEERLQARRTEVSGRYAEAHAEAEAAAATVAGLQARREELAAHRGRLVESAGAAGREAEAASHAAWEAAHQLAGVQRELAQQAAPLEQLAEVLGADGVRGQVGDLLHPLPAAAAVLDRAWRSWLELPVVRDDALTPAARAQVALLESALEVAVAGGADEPLPTLELAGAQALLPLAGIEPSERGWLERVLPPAYRCDDAARARVLAVEHPEVLVVDPDGAVWRGRTVHLPTRGGGLRGALELRAERTRLEAAHAAASERAAAARGEQGRLGEELTAAERELAAASSALVGAEQERARSTGLEGTLGAELARLERELEALAGESARTTAARAEARRRHQELESELRGLERHAEELERTVAAGGTAVEERRREAAEALRALDRWRAEERLARERCGGVRSEVERLERELQAAALRSAQLAERHERQQAELAATEDEVVRSRARLVEEQGMLAAARQHERRLAEQTEREAGALARREKEVVARRARHEEARGGLHALEVDEARVGSEWDRLRELAQADLQTAPEALLTRALPEDAEEEALRSRVEDLRQRLEKLGPVNLLAIREVAELSERSTFLHAQRKDLVDAVESLRTTIRDIDATCTQRFLATFQTVNSVFAETFRHLFGGGAARLELVDEDDPLESGIDILAQPPGKKNQSVQLLSGGEKALTALSLLIALFRTRPSPFCVLDEVDAPLDDANVERLAELVREMAEHTQFVLVTHNRRTMARADVLYGVTMEEPGVSKVVSVRME